MNNDDSLHRFRLALFASAETIGVTRACRTFNVHRSTYYRWRRRVRESGLEMLRPRERRRPRMPNQVPPLVEQDVVAFALGHPGLGPARIAAELRQPRWGGLELSPNGVWRVLARHGLNTRQRRLGLLASSIAAPALERPEPLPEAHLDATEPGDLVQLDSFYVGRLSRHQGVVWQYTAIDVASSYTWATLQLTPHNPSARFSAELLRTVATELSERGWTLRAITTDNGSEFRARAFTDVPLELTVDHRFIKAGRPQSNGCVERVQRTILEECWRPTFARSLVLEISTLKDDLARYLRYYNTRRPHTGRLTRGRIPATILAKNKTWS